MDLSKEFVSGQLQYVFNNLSEAVCVTNRTGVLLYVNPAAKKLVHVTETSGHTKKIWEYIPFVENNDVLIQLFIDAVSQGKHNRQSLITYENKDGKVFKLRVSLNYTQDEGGILIIIMNDLTDFLRVNSAFARYTSPQIAEYVLGSPEGELQGGESREVTILMSDLRDFTGMVAGLEPDRLVLLVNHYFEAMVEIIEKRKGTVIEFLGDGIFAVFGAPKEDEKHASNAVKCALEMQNRMDDVNEWNRQNGFPELFMGIGINSGQAVVGNIGSRLKMKYGCMGNTVNLAGRTESFTVGGQIYVTEYTAALIGDALKYRDVHAVRVKGKKEPFNIYDVKGIGTKLHLRKKERTVWMQEHDCAYETTVFFVTDKVVDGAGMPGVIRRISKDHRYALLHTGGRLPVMQNIVLTICGELFAKVTDFRDDDNIICFTSEPEGLEDWIGSLAEP